MKRKIFYIIGAITVIIIILAIIGSGSKEEAIQELKQNESLIEDTNSETPVIKEESSDSQVLGVKEKETSINSVTYKYYPIVSVVDGDTVKLNIDGQTETFRLIGLDTPETVNPRKTVQCFGVEASNKAKELLYGKKVRIETDPTQGTYDKYNRLLGYVYTEDGLFYNKYMIEQGYAHEYTYNIPYKYQIEFKNAQKQAQANKAGLWSPNTCNGDTTTEKITTTPTITPTATNTTSSCMIKGNISSSKEKIYHMVGCGSYNQTVIDESKGEKWFCTEQEAISAGWRKALNCN
jgi:micrococcal nuclease